MVASLTYSKCVHKLDYRAIADSGTGEAMVLPLFGNLKNIFIATLLM